MSVFLALYWNAMCQLFVIVPKYNNLNDLIDFDWWYMLYCFDLEYLLGYFSTALDNIPCEISYRHFVKYKKVAYKNLILIVQYV